LTLRLLSRRDRLDWSTKPSCSIVSSGRLARRPIEKRLKRIDRLLAGLLGALLGRTAEPGLLDEAEDKEENEASLEELSEYGGSAKDTDFVVPVLDAAECHEVEEGEGGAIMREIGRGNFCTGMRSTVTVVRPEVRRLNKSVLMPAAVSQEVDGKSDAVLTRNATSLGIEDQRNALYRNRSKLHG